MVVCQEFIGKIISSFTIYEDSIDGPEICIEFSDGTVFSSCLKTSTALEAKVIDEPLLHGREMVAVCEPFDRRHVLPVHGLHGGDARMDRFAVDNHRTRAAGGHTAAKLCTGQPQVVAQHPEKAPVLVNVEPVGGAVDRHGDRFHDAPPFP